MIAIGVTIAIAAVIAITITMVITVITVALPGRLSPASPISASDLQQKSPH